MDWNETDIVSGLLLAALAALVLTPYAAQFRAAFLFFDFIDRGLR